MDALVTSTTVQANDFSIWDFAVKTNPITGKNYVPIISGTNMQSQQATIIAYTQRGLIPQNRSVGVNWTGLLTGNENFSSIDTQIVQGLSRNALPYKPVYSQDGLKVKVTIVPQ